MHIRHLSLLALAVVATLTACAAKPQPIAPLPYRFTFASFEDTRTEEAKSDPRQIGQPFQPRRFVQSLRTAMPATLFGSMDARLAVNLKHYEITSFQNHYAMSIVAEIGGTDIHDRPLVKETCACSQVDKEGFMLADYATQVYAERNLHGLTLEGRAASMWQKLYDACVQELVTQYAIALENESLRPATATAR